MKDCKHTNIIQVEVDHYGLAAFRDECSDCGCIMVPDFNNPVDGVVPFKALPLAKVLDFNEFKARRALKEAAEVKVEGEESNG